MHTAEETAYKISEFASKYVRYLGPESKGLYIMELSDCCTSVKDINIALESYDDTTPDNRGKGFKARVDSVYNNHIVFRIRYVKIKS